MSKYAKNDPYRSPDWRMDRVKALVGDAMDPRPASRADDPYVRRMKAFRVRWQATLGDERGMAQLREEFSECAIAQQLAENGADDNPGAGIVTTLIEARLLARQSHEEIALLAGTSPRAVEWYEALYFNVQDRLDARDWVTTQILVPAVADQIKRDRQSTQVGPVARPFLDGTVKLFGYFCGPRAVDVIASGFEGFQNIQTQEELDAWYDDHWRRTIRRRSVQAAQTFEINKFNVTELFAVHLRIIDLEQSPGAQRKAKTDFEARLKAAIDTLPYSPAELSGGDFRPGQLDAISLLAIEPSAKESARLAAGEAPAAVFDAETLSLTVPPPRRAPVVDKS